MKESNSGSFPFIERCKEWSTIGQVGNILKKQNHVSIT